jgi:hypothetical protein
MTKKTLKTGVAAGLIGAAALSGTAQANATGPQVNQLIASVCDASTYTEERTNSTPQNPSPLPHSTTDGDCVAKTNASDTLFIGSYASNSAVQYDLTHLSDWYRKLGASEEAGKTGGTYVAIPFPDGSILLFENSSGNYSTVTLAPLQVYGYTIDRNPPQA